MISKTVLVKCTGAGLLPLEALKDFQGGLKRRTSQQIKQIETSIEKYGFSFPFFVWKSGKDNWCLDGHGRMATLAKMQADGWDVPDLPVVYVEAKDRAEAKQKLLRMNSNYGDWDAGGVAEFLSDIDVELSEIAIFEMNKIEAAISLTVDELQHAGASPWDRVGEASDGIVFHFGDIVERVPEDLYRSFVGTKRSSIAEWLQNVLHT